MDDGIENGTSSTPDTGASPSAAPSALASLEKVSADSSPAASPAAPGTPPAPGTPGAPAAVTTRPSGAGGEAPEHRIQAAVRNARADVERQYAWVQQVVPQGFQPADVQAAVTLLQRLRADPRAFNTDLGRELGGGGAPDADPEPDLVSEDGRYKTYSDKTLQQLWQRREAKLRAALHEELAPVFGFVQTEQQARQQAQLRHEASGQATTILTAARDLPHFAEHEDAIRDRMLALLEADPSIVERDGAKAVLYEAYNHVLRDAVFPTLGRRSESKVLTDLQRKATAAAGSVHPTQHAGQPRPPDIKQGDVKGLAQRMRQMAESRAT
jgi:hypothetical protein